MCACAGEDRRDCPALTHGEVNEPRECDERRAEQMVKLQHDLDARRLLVHAENIERFAPALKERPRQRAQRRNG